jgi:hypothetical protein
MFLSEYCKLHGSNEIEVLCNCNSKLCNKCVGDHFHENMIFSSIKQAIFNFHSEVNKNLKIISQIVNKLKCSGMRMDEKYSTMLLNSLNQIETNMLTFIQDKFYITYDMITNFKKNKFNEKIFETICENFNKSNEDNRKAIDELIRQKVEKKLNSPILSRSRLRRVKRDSSIKNIKRESSPIVSSSKSLVKLQNNINVIISNMKDNTINTNKNFASISKIFPCNKSPKTEYDNKINLKEKVADIDLATAKYGSLADKTPIRISISHLFDSDNISSITNNKIKLKHKINSTLLRPGNITSNYDFHFENQNDFLSSPICNIKTCLGKKDDMVKIVCVTCRDKFTISKDQSNWRTRCDLCTRNNDN